jgi:hypothetical protein
MQQSREHGWKPRNKKAGSKPAFLSEKDQINSGLFRWALINAF